MKLSISNLAFPGVPIEIIGPKLRAAGISGVEIAPTAVWSDVASIPRSALETHAAHWAHHGIKVSGIQSLLYGHPELQLFDQQSWPALAIHLESMLEIAAGLGAPVAVFGSH